MPEFSFLSIVMQFFFYGIREKMILNCHGRFFKPFLLVHELLCVMLKFSRILNYDHLYFHFNELVNSVLVLNAKTFFF